MLLIMMQLLPNRIPFGNVLEFAVTTITRKSLRLNLRCSDLDNLGIHPHQSYYT